MTPHGVNVHSSQDFPSCPNHYPEADVYKFHASYSLSLTTCVCVLYFEASMVTYLCNQLFNNLEVIFDYQLGLFLLLLTIRQKAISGVFLGKIIRIQTFMKFLMSHYETYQVSNGVFKTLRCFQCQQRVFFVILRMGELSFKQEGYHRMSCFLDISRSEFYK